MKKNFLVFLTLVLAPASFADTIPSLQERLADVDQSCFQRDWAATPCKFAVGDDHSSSGGETFKRTLIVDDLTTLLLSLTKRFGIDSSLYYIRRFAAQWGIHADDDAIQRRVNFVKLTNQAEDVANRKNLSACQRACLANCISSHALIYVDQAKIRSLVPADSLARGTGVCQQFSTLSAFLSHSLGNLTFAVGSLRMEHEFVITRIDQKWWFSEPQDDACHFYPARNIDL